MLHGVSKPRLELRWIDKDRRIKLEPRILIEDRLLSYPPAKRLQRGGAGVDSNKLIFGDNLLGLKALEQDFAGQVKCCFIDPPYNTGSAFAHYDDGLEHSIWLGLMRDRLEIIHRLLSDDGSLWITIDDHEAHYLKVMCDEIFGRRNFVANVVWQKRTSPDARLRLGGAHDHILVFAKNFETVSLNKLVAAKGDAKNYRNPDDDPRGIWTSTDFTAQGWRPNQMYTIVSPAGVRFEPPAGRCWANIEPAFRQLRQDNRIWFGSGGAARPRIKNFLSERDGVAAWSWWDNDVAGHNQEAKKESISLFGAECAFATPKPERLIERVLSIATNPGDLVLDSFAGSGTTGAVAHKMGRRWIMIELGEHCHTHIIPRLKRVVDGADSGGITKSVGWAGGGSFRYYALAPSLLERDKHGREVIAKSYSSDMLIEAVCKLQGFKYDPSETVYWRHGHSTERDFIYVIPESLSTEQIAQISKDVGSKRSLLVMCRAFASKRSRPQNLTLKKIPNSFLQQYAWGGTDYRLNIVSTPPTIRPVR